MRPCVFFSALSLKGIRGIFGQIRSKAGGLLYRYARYWRPDFLSSSPAVANLSDLTEHQLATAAPEVSLGTMAAKVFPMPPKPKQSFILRVPPNSKLGQDLLQDATNRPKTIHQLVLEHFLTFLPKPD
ncbi:hypothetical protein QTO34_013453 [Cnephaeus nilssonii]|uniref:Uncharacterized protein n=1 Tax=Cnephaeus nilssonii TaxID=3371016 RepID=A0AA40I815_CNENI|nr:hypothetical protein QTO34_013453 [Eptesicus nilssonii]